MPNRDAIIAAASMLSEVRGPTGEKGPSSKPEFKAEGEFIPPERSSIPVEHDPETGFPLLPKGYWWRVSKDTMADAHFETLKLELMCDEKVVSSNWIVGHTTYGNYTRPTPTRKVVLNYATSMYTEWAYRMMWDKALEVQVGEFGRD